MTEDQARQRFMVMNLMRIFALVLVALGIANIAGRLLPDFSPILGYVLLIAGALDFFLVPIILKKHWQTPDA